MKSKIWLLTIVVFPLLFSGCDYIDAPYTIPGPNGCTVAQPTFVPRTNPVKKVLVEDVTGHRCGNCPRAAETIIQLATTYGNQVVPVALHSSLSGAFTEILSTDTNINPEQKYTYDFRTSLATDIDGTTTFGASSAGLPNGFVNRRDNGSGNRFVGYSTWSNRVAAELSTPQLVDIQLKNFWNPADNSICSFYYVKALADLPSNYKICLFLVENDIEGWQKDYSLADPDIEHYFHEHVLRASFNGVWGTALNSGSSLVNGGEYIDGFSVTIDPAKWNIDNLHVVAFVFDGTNREVLQAEDVKVTP